MGRVVRRVQAPCCQHTSVTRRWPPGPQLDLPLGRSPCRRASRPGTGAFPAISADGLDATRSDVGRRSGAHRDRNGEHGHRLLPEGRQTCISSRTSTARAAPVSSRNSAPVTSPSIPSASMTTTRIVSSCSPWSTTVAAMNHGSPSPCRMTVIQMASGTSTARGRLSTIDGE